MSDPVYVIKLGSSPYLDEHGVLHQGPIPSVPSYTAMVRRSGLALIIAGLLFGTFMFLHPANTPEGALNPIWMPVHLMWFVSYLLMLFGLNGMYPVLANEPGRLASAAWVLSLAGPNRRNLWLHFWKGSIVCKAIVLMGARQANHAWFLTTPLT